MRDRLGWKQMTCALSSTRRKPSNAFLKLAPQRFSPSTLTKTLCLSVWQWSRSADSTVAEWIRERSLLLDDLEEYNSSECSRIRSATVESAERDQWLSLAEKVIQWALADSSLRLVSTPRSSKNRKVRANHIKESVNAHWGCVPILLLVLKIYSIRYVHYRFSVLALISEHSLSGFLCWTQPMCIRWRCQSLTRWARVRESRVGWTLFSSLDSSQNCQCFFDVDLKRKKILSIPFTEFLIYYITYLSH